MICYRHRRYSNRHENRYNECPNFIKCGNLKRKESLACRNCYTKVSPFNKKTIIESFGKLFK